MKFTDDGKQLILESHFDPVNLISIVGIFAVAIVTAVLHFLWATIVLVLLAIWCVYLGGKQRLTADKDIVVIEKTSIFHIFHKQSRINVKKISSISAEYIGSHTLGTNPFFVESPYIQFSLRLVDGEVVTFKSYGYKLLQKIPFRTVSTKFEWKTEEQEIVAPKLADFLDVPLQK